MQRRHAEAKEPSQGGIAIGCQFGDRRAIAWCLGLVAARMRRKGGRCGPHGSAVRWKGCSKASASVEPTYRAWIGERLFPALRQELGTDVYQRMMAKGRAMSPSQAVELRMEGGDAGGSRDVTH